MDQEAVPIAQDAVVKEPIASADAAKSEQGAPPAPEPLSEEDREEEKRAKQIVSSSSFAIPITGGRGGGAVLTVLGGYKGAE